MSDAIKAETKEKDGAAVNEQASEKGGLLNWIQRIANGMQKEKHEENLDWTLDSSGIETISAITTNGSIKFTASDETAILVKAHKVIKAPELATAQSFSEAVQIHVARDGDRVAVSVEHPKPPHGVNVEVSFAITAPRTIAIIGKTTNGSARIEQFHSNVDLKSTNGTVHVTEVAGHVQAQTTNGDVRLCALAGPVTAKTTNGAVKAEGITIEEVANFASHNGSVKVAIRAGDAPITATTHNGAVRLTLPTDHAGVIEAHTHNGRVQHTLPMQTTRQSRTKLSGRLGSDSDTPITVRSHNGSVTLVGQA